MVEVMEVVTVEVMLIVMVVEDGGGCDENGLW